jgi:hypothetical protein
MRPTFAALCLYAAALASDARAELSPCVTSVAGAEVVLHYDPEDPRVATNMSRREAWFGDWGRITCPSVVTLRYLTPDLTDDQRGSFCLSYDRKTRTYDGFAVGERDAFALCKAPTKSFCARVNDSKAAALAITGFAARLAGAGDVAQAASDVSVLTADNGAVTLAGTGADVLGALSRIGASALTAATAPAPLGAAAVAVVAVGGAVYLCRERPAGRGEN